MVARLVGAVVGAILFLGACGFSQPDFSGYRYKVTFGGGSGSIVYWTNMPMEFGYLDTMTCVYIGVDSRGNHFDRVCEPAAMRVSVWDRYGDSK